MPITAFNSFTDGLEPNRRNREHFITNTDLDDDRLWVPYANGVWFQPCCFNVTSGGFSLLELTRKYYREAGLDVRKLDALVR